MKPKKDVLEEAKALLSDLEKEIPNLGQALAASAAKTFGEMLQSSFGKDTVSSEDRAIIVVNIVQATLSVGKDIPKDVAMWLGNMLKVAMIEQGLLSMDKIIDLHDRWKAGWPTQANHETSKKIKEEIEAQEAMNQAFGKGTPQFGPN